MQPVPGYVFQALFFKLERQHMKDTLSGLADIRVQADGNGFSVHHGSGHGIAAAAGNHQGLARSRRGRCFQVDGNCP